MKALDLLRGKGPGLVAALESTRPAREVLEPFAHLLRAVVDDRPLSERIEATVREHVPLLIPLYHDAPTVRGAQVRLDKLLPLLPLATVPDVRTIAAAMERLALEQSGGVLYDRASRTSYATTIGST